MTGSTMVAHSVAGPRHEGDGTPQVHDRQCAAGGLNQTESNGKCG